MRPIQFQLRSASLAVSILLCLFPCVTRAQAHIGGGGALVFAQNDGSIIGSDGAARPDIAYVARSRDMDVYFRWTGVSYVFHRGGLQDANRQAAVAQDSRGARMDVFRADVAFPGSNPAARLEAEGAPLASARSYRGATRPRELQSFARLVYRDLYRNIDLFFTATDGKLKYEFIVRPGGDPSEIRIAYSGSETPALQTDGSVLLHTPLGDLREEAPFTYTAPSTFRTDQPYTPSARDGVPSAFALEQGELRFRVGAFDRTRTLVIDPGLIWSTYLGGGSEDWGYAIALDAAGNSYVTGATLSSTFPVLAGRQMSIVSSYDAFVTKFTSTGHLIWSTYFGGNDIDYGFGIASDASGNAAVCGWTRSSNFPTLNPAQPGPAGDLDAFVARFDSSGTLLWSTYLGGSIEDRAMDVAIDGAGNILATGWTYSADFPILTPVQAVTAGVSDLFVVKYNPAGARIWSTFYGGTGSDEGWDIDADAGGNVYLGGRTTSTDFPVSNAYQSKNAGGRDAFVVKLSSSALRQWGTYLGGKEDDDGYGVAVDGSGNVSLVGSTLSENFPVLGAFQSTHVDVYDAFIARFNGSGGLQWSTYYGGYSADIAQAVACDNAGNTVVVGSTGSITLPIRNAPMDKHAGDEVFVARFSTTGAVQLAGYIGGGNNEGASGVAVSPAGSIYVTGTTNSYNFPTAFPFQAGHAGGGWDAFVFKLDDCPRTATATALGPTIFCPGGSVTLRANSAPGVTYQWYKDWSKAGSGDQQDFVATDSGKYYVLVKGPDDCLSTSEMIRVSLSVMTTSGFPDTIICEGGTARLGVGIHGGRAPYNYVWSPAGTLNSANAAAPTARPDSTTMYYVTVTDSVGCVSSDSMRVVIRPLRVDAGANSFICPGGKAQLASGVVGGSSPYTYQWQPSTGLSQTGIPDPVASPSSTTTYALMVTDGIGCVVRDSVTVTVSSLSATPSPNVTVCYRESAALSVVASGGTPPYNYRWTPSIGLSSPTSASTAASTLVTTAYTVTVTDAVGCSVTARSTVFVNPQVPFAISHNGPLALCRGDSVTLTAQGGFGSYRWSTGATTPRIVVKQTGLYRVIAVDSLGCPLSDSVVVDIFDVPQPAITALRALTFCPGDSTVLDAGAGFASYRWSSGDTTRFLIIKTSGVHSVAVSAATGCTGRSSSIVTRVKAAPTPVIAGPSSVCPGSIMIYSIPAIRGTKYRWSVSGGSAFGGDTTAALTVRWGNAGSGRVTIAQTDDTTGCSGIAVYDVSITSTIKPVIGPAKRISLCDGGSATLDAGAGYANYQWTLPGGVRDSSRLISASKSGLYILSVRDAGGCEGRDTAIVEIRALLLPLIAADPAPALCDGDSALLRTTVAYARYRWSTGDTTATIVLRSSAVVTVDVTDDLGCTGVSAPLSVGVRAKPAVSFNAAAFACRDDDVVYDAENPSAPGHSFAWTATRGTIVSGAFARRCTVRWDGNSPGILTLRVTVDSSGCFAERSAAVVIAEHPAPKITLFGKTVFCEGDSVRFYLPGVFRSIRWNTGDTVRTIVAKSSGAFVATVIDSNFCAGHSDTIRIAVRPAPQASITGPSSVCLNASEEYRAPASSSVRFSWTVLNGTLLSGAGTDAIRVRWDAQGSGRVQLRVSDDSSSCEASSELLVAVSTSLHPRVTASAPLSRCAGDTLTLRADAGYQSYEWREASGRLLGSNPEIAVTQTGAYSVFVRDASGCSGTSDTLPATFHPLPTPVILGPDAFCAGDTITLDAGAGYAAVIWLDGAGQTVGSGRTLRIDAAGVYRALVKDANGCSGISPDHAVARFPDPAIPLISRNGDTLTSSSAAAWTWFLDGQAIAGAKGQRHIATADGRYSVRITDANGCRSESAPIDVLRSASIVTAVEVDAVRAAPGDRVVVPLRLTSQSNIAALSPRDFKAELRFNKNLLFPTGSTPLGSIQGGDRVIPVNGIYTDNQTLLSEMSFIAMLGDTDRTALRLANFRWADARATASVADGSFELTVCSEGGKRLFDGGARFSVSAHPNPFNASTVIEYTTIESGAVRLQVIDALGRTVAMLADGPQPAGTARVLFDASALASGTYRVLLTSGRLSNAVLIMLAK